MQNSNIYSITETTTETLNESLQIVQNINFSNGSLPSSPIFLENEIINLINTFEPIRNQLINNINLRSSEVNMDLFSEFVSNINTEQQEILYSLISQSSVITHYQPALILLGIFTNFNGSVSLDLVLSDMTGVLLEVMHNNNNNLELNSLSTQIVNTEISNDPNVIENIQAIVSNNRNENEVATANFISDLIARSNSVIRQIRVNEILNRVYQFFLIRPHLLFQIIQSFNNRRISNNIDNNVVLNNNSPQNLTLRELLINFYDWLSNLAAPRER